MKKEIKKEEKKVKKGLKKDMKASIEEKALGVEVWKIKRR